MDYQVWIKEEFVEGYRKVDCGDLGAARREIDKAVRAGQEPILTQEVPYEISIKVGEAGSDKAKPKKEAKKSTESKEEDTELEATQSETEPDQSTGA